MDEERAEALAQFMAITSQEADVAMNMLEAADYNLESAVNLFFTAGPAGVGAATGGEAPARGAPMETDEDVARRLQEETYGSAALDEVRAADAVRTERLYDVNHPNVMQRQASLQEPPPIAMDAFRDFSTEDESNDLPMGQQGLADLFKPPKDLMYAGGFDQAKNEASENNKWLIVNIQSNEEFASHQLNRDTWADEAVHTMLKTFFLFWQTYDISQAGQKVCSFYKLVQFPVIMVIDPITGACLAQWQGYLDPEQLLEKLEPFLESTPEEGGPKIAVGKKRQSKAAAASSTPAMTEDEEIAKAMALSMADTGGDGAGTSGMAVDADVHQAVAAASSNADEVVAQALSDLPDEPSDDDPDSGRVAIRLPDGQRVQRRFPKSASMKAIRDFCIVSVPEAGTGRAFSIKPAYPGAQELSDENETLEAAGVLNSMVVMGWSA